MPPATGAWKKNRSVCRTCKNATGAAEEGLDAGVPCDYGPIDGVGHGKRECQVCSNWRSRDLDQRWAHKCEIPKTSNIPIFRQYGRYTPNEYRAMRCQRCVELGNKYCDVDEYLGLACTACKPLQDSAARVRKGKAPAAAAAPTKGKGKKSDADWGCVLSEHPERRLDPRPHVVGDAIPWFRHMCQRCEQYSGKELRRLKNKKQRGAKWKGTKTDEDDDPNVVGCSWLRSRSAQLRACQQCLEGDGGQACEKDAYINMNTTVGGDRPVNKDIVGVGDVDTDAHTNTTPSGATENHDGSGPHHVSETPTPEAPRAPPNAMKLVQSKTWAPREGEGGNIPLKAHSETGGRIMCKWCTDAGTKCYLPPGANALVEACVRCTQQGLNCIDYRQYEWPIGDLNDVGFGHYTPFWTCDRCHETGRPCDRQTPCDSCWKNNEPQPCRGGPSSTKYRGCILDRLNPPPGPLYYLAMGYGPGGVDDVKTGNQLVDWIGPPRAIYSVRPPDGPVFKAQATTHKALQARKGRRAIPPGQPPSLNWKPAYAMNIDDLEQMILSKWPRAKPPNHWLADDDGETPQGDDGVREGRIKRPRKRKPSADPISPKRSERLKRKRAHAEEASEGGAIAGSENIGQGIPGTAGHLAISTVATGGQNQALPPPSSASPSSLEVPNPTKVGPYGNLTPINTNSSAAHPRIGYPQALTTAPQTEPWHSSNAPHDWGHYHTAVRNAPGYPMEQAEGAQLLQTPLLDMPQSAPLPSPQSLDPAQARRPGSPIHSFGFGFVGSPMGDTFWHNPPLPSFPLQQEQGVQVHGNHVETVANSAVQPHLDVPGPGFTPQLALSNTPVVQEGYAQSQPRPQPHAGAYRIGGYLQINAHIEQSTGWIMLRSHEGPFVQRWYIPSDGAEKEVRLKVWEQDGDSIFEGSFHDTERWLDKETGHIFHKQPTGNSAEDRRVEFWIPGFTHADGNMSLYVCDGLAGGGLEEARQPSDPNEHAGDFDTSMIDPSLAAPAQQQYQSQGQVGSTHVPLFPAVHSPELPEGLVEDGLLRPGNGSDTESLFGQSPPEQ